MPRRQWHVAAWKMTWPFASHSARTFLGMHTTCAKRTSGRSCTHAWGGYLRGYRELWGLAPTRRLSLQVS
jgi:hypothetical protein